MCVVQSPDEAAAMKAVDAAFKSGVNFFDVAPFYASGDAERVCINQHTCVPTSKI
jgi:aryl-alcohol dehydrogenase-like predicted oxidoreductase